MRTIFVWCPECQAMYQKNDEGCTFCGAPPRHQVSRFAARRQATALMGARAASNLNYHKRHAIENT